MDDNRRLVIRIGQGSLAFSTVESGEVMYERYALNSSISMAANMREALKQVPMLQMKGCRTLVMIDTPVLIVPVNEFKEEQCELLYQHAFRVQEQQVVLHAVLPDLNSVSVFAVQKDLRTVLTDAFAEVRFMPVMASVWHHLLQRSFTGKHEKLFAYFHERRLEVFAFQKNRFKFCNTYQVNNPNDALYYLLAVWKQLAMDAEHDELHLVGDVTEREQLMEEAQKFIKRVFYINPSGEFNRAAVTQIEGMPYDLVTLYVKGR
jgi:hypothetical protein